MAKILVVDDSTLIRELTVRFLTAAGHTTVALPDGSQLGPNLVSMMPELVILDYFLPGSTGRELYQLIRSDARGAGMSVIFLTGKPASELKPLFSRDPLVTFLAKPLDGPLLLRAVDRALGRA